MDIPIVARMTRRLSAAQARRIGVAAQGLAGPRPASAGRATLRRTIDRLGVLQLDTVNVFERSHYLPLLARLGPYDRALLDAMLGHDQAGSRTGAYTEWVAHEACIVPVADWPLWGWHRDSSVRDGFRGWAAEKVALVEEVRHEFATRGPMRISDLTHPANVSSGGGWWNRNEAYWAATWLFRRGDLAVVGRRRFERILGIATDVLPAEVHDPLPREEAILELVRRASRAYGVATADDLTDYYRLRRPDGEGAVGRLVAAGELEEVEVAGWDRPGYLAAGARVPRRVTAAALLSPFDPLVWYRPRALRMFGFHYRISIYTPAAKREHGYYVLPVLVDDELVGRADLKSDRRSGRLLLQHAHVEPGHAGRADELAARVAPLLHEAAAWQGLGEVTPTGVGTWGPALAARL